MAGGMLLFVYSKAPHSLIPWQSANLHGVLVSITHYIINIALIFIISHALI